VDLHGGLAGTTLRAFFLRQRWTILLSTRTTRIPPLVDVKPTGAGRLSLNGKKAVALDDLDPGG
jgi:hypothetical protein